MFELYQSRTNLGFIIFRSLITAFGFLLVINYFFPGFIEKDSFLNNKFLITFVNLISGVLYSKYLSFKYIGNLVVEDKKLKMPFLQTETSFKELNIFRVYPHQLGFIFDGKMLKIEIPKLSNEEFTIFFEKDDKEKFKLLLNEINEINPNIIESNFIGRRIFQSSKKVV